MLKEVWLAFAIALAFAPTEAAVPTEAECKAVMAKMVELTEDDYAALKAKKKSSAETAAAILQYVEDEDRAAERIVLLRMAFEQYVIAKDFLNANAVYQKARKLGGVEFAVMVAIPMRSKLSTYPSSRYPAVKALRELVSSDEKSIQRIRTLKKSLAKDPGNSDLCENLGNECAAIGDWETALSAFVTTKGEVQKIAEWELDGGQTREDPKIGGCQSALTMCLDALRKGFQLLLARPCIAVAGSA